MEQHPIKFTTFSFEQENTVVQWAFKLNIAVTAVENWQ
jgi:hypothetical protein